ncbi:hypothetical protein EEB19_13645 [Gordonia sp. OPL2]|nr:hypothetical protein EEB19_13645 [Gordonia sp. OPL2]
MAGSQEEGDRHGAVGRCDLRPDRRRSTAGLRQGRVHRAEPEQDHRDHPNHLGRAEPADVGGGRPRAERVAADADPAGRAAGE